MNEIKEKLKEVLVETMIPEVESYLKDLHKVLEKNEQTDDDMEAIRDMESFLLELENVLLAINENKINEEEASTIYERVLALIEESDEH